MVAVVVDQHRSAGGDGGNEARHHRRVLRMWVLARDCRRKVVEDANGGALLEEGTYERGTDEAAPARNESPDPRRAESEKVELMSGRAYSVVRKGQDAVMNRPGLSSARSEVGAQGEEKSHPDGGREGEGDQDAPEESGPKALYGRLGLEARSFNYVGVHNQTPLSSAAYRAVLLCPCSLGRVILVPGQVWGGGLAASWTVPGSPVSRVAGHFPLTNLYRGMVVTRLNLRILKCVSTSGICGCGEGGTSIDGRASASRTVSRDHRCVRIAGLASPWLDSRAFRAR